MIIWLLACRLSLVSGKKARECWCQGICVKGKYAGKTVGPFILCIQRASNS